MTEWWLELEIEQRGNTEMRLEDDIDDEVRLERDKNPNEKGEVVFFSFFFLVRSKGKPRKLVKCWF